MSASGHAPFAFPEGLLWPLQFLKSSARCAIIEAGDLVSLESGALFQAARIHQRRTTDTHGDAQSPQDFVIVRGVSTKDALAENLSSLKGLLAVDALVAVELLIEREDDDEYRRVIGATGFSPVNVAYPAVLGRPSFWTLMEARQPRTSTLVATFAALRLDADDLFVYVQNRVAGGLREGYSTELLELPQGHVDDGETPLGAAFRELEEEAGQEPIAVFENEHASGGATRPFACVSVTTPQRYTSLVFAGATEEVGPPEGAIDSRGRWIALDDLVTLARDGKFFSLNVATIEAISDRRHDLVEWLAQIGEQATRGSVGLRAQHNLRTYEMLATQYADRRDSDFENDIPFVDRIWQTLQSRVKRRPLTTLDVGCGMGVNVRMFQDRGALATGIDFSEAMVELARTTAPESRILHGDALASDFLEESFDLVFAKAFFHLFPLDECAMVLDSLRRYLAPNGLIYISTTLAASSHEGFFPKSDYSGLHTRFRRYWAPADLKAWFLGQGVDVHDSWNSYQPSQNKHWQNYLLGIRA